ncbi:hypothetical protein OKW30_006043 [Paraburkholderia sp. Clong3]|uniref:hypothetical protein n=1 Tax=Paraburkholderia sp. Clong3 TaxID=2991061 RepID=UPI003D1C3BE7
MRIFTECRISLGLISAICFASASADATPICPLGYGATDAAKSHKLFLYFPTVDDAAYPANFTAKVLRVRIEVLPFGEARC